MGNFFRERVIGTEPHSCKTWLKFACVVLVVFVVVVGLVITVLGLVKEVQRNQNLIFYNTTTDLPDMTKNQITVYIDIMNIEPNSFIIRTATDFLASGQYGANFGPQNYNIFLQSVTFVMDSNFRLIPAGINPSPSYNSFMVHGDLNVYPFEVWYCLIDLQMFKNGTNIFNATPVPFSVVFSGYQSGYDFSGTQINTIGNTGGQALLYLEMRRTFPTKIMAICYIIFLWLISIIVFGIAVDTLLRKRKIYAPFPIFFGVMLIALPSLRNSQPGAPPPGTSTDFFSFQFNMILICVSFVIGCSLYVFRYTKEDHLESQKVAINSGEPPEKSPENLPPTSNIV